MIERLSVSLEARSRPQLALGVCVLIAVIGALDYATGYEIAFAFFYIVPVSIAAWYLSRKFGILCSVVCAAVWLAADVMSGHPYSHAFIPFWNAATRCGFFVVTAVLLTDVHDLLEQLSRRAQRDPLTDLLNGVAFLESCDVLLKLAARQGQPMSLGYIDLDEFKAINDTLGHGAGDQVLRAVAGTIAARARASDAVGRLGGDEFAVLLANTDLNGATTFFTDVQEHLAQLCSERGWPVGASIGVVAFPTPPPSSEEALSIAERLMYEVKQSTKNAICFLQWTSPRGSIEVVDAKPQIHRVFARPATS